MHLRDVVGSERTKLGLIDTALVKMKLIRMESLSERIVLSLVSFVHRETNDHAGG